MKPDPPVHLYGGVKDHSTHPLRVETSISTLPRVAEVSPDPLKGTTMVVVSGRVEVSAMGHPLQVAEVFPGPAKAGAAVVLLALELPASS
jgi:hypothetical protein